jgi:hypothetical protein
MNILKKGDRILSKKEQNIGYFNKLIKDKYYTIILVKQNNDDEYSYELIDDKNELFWFPEHEIFDWFYTKREEIKIKLQNLNYNN